MSWISERTSTRAVNIKKNNDGRFTANDEEEKGTGSGRQGHNPADESSAMQIARFMHVAIPQFAEGNLAFIAWCKRPGCPVDIEPLRWEQPGGLASMGA